MRKTSKFERPSPISGVLSKRARSAGTQRLTQVLFMYCTMMPFMPVQVLSPPSTGDCKSTDTCSHNTDAVDVHGEPFYIHNVNFTTGDDNVAMHVLCCVSYYLSHDPTPPPFLVTPL